MEFANGALSALLKPCLSSPWWKPVGIIGMAVEFSGSHWLLGGSAVEDIVERFLPRAPAVQSVTVIGTDDPDAAAYLDTVVDLLRGGEAVTPPPSLRAVERPLSSSIAEDVEQWLARHPTGVLYLSGPVHDRAVAEDDQTKTARLLIRIGHIGDKPPTWTVQLFSDKPAWLTKDLMVKKVADLAAKIAAAAGGTFRSYLHLEGRVLDDKLAQIKDAFPEQ
jgi:hypothetical protein